MLDDVFEFIETDSEGNKSGEVYWYKLKELRLRLDLQWPTETRQFNHLIALAVASPRHPVDLTVWRDLEAMRGPQGERSLRWSARLTYHRDNPNSAAHSDEKGVAVSDALKYP